MNLAKKLIKDLKKFKKVNLILSGGKSPLKDYKILFNKKLKWNDINLFLLDERLVRLNDKKSNFHNIDKILKANNLKNKLEPINKIYLDKIKVNQISKKLKKNTTIAVLGMGNDGHYASIFLNSKKYKLLTDLRSPPSFNKVEALGVPKVPRVTMNLSMILLSSKIYLILNNKKKISLYKKACISLDYKKYSICSLIKASKKIIHIKDLS